MGINMFKTINFFSTFTFCSAIIFSQVKLDVNTIPTKVDIHLDGVNIGSSPIKNERISQSHLNSSKLKKSIESNDINSFIEVVENEALTLHALMMTSNPNFILFKPNTINIIEHVLKFRDETNTKICFTLDAGANVHLLYPKNSFQIVQDFIKKSLIIFCDEGRFINDQVGLGPEKN